ncbi:MAG: indole-3-glycerol phosphate synthase TrpC [Syntrophaceae bacterium]|nr:indole-3-glycerol phosphate synthase TrpC [Syntrophaceae bacterium]
MILDKIIKTKKEEVAQLKKKTTQAQLQKKIAGLEPCRNFQKALKSGVCNIIAEVKCASPSRGRLVNDFDPLKIAKIYEKNGAAAVSVLSDEKYFAGHKNHLTQIRKNIKLPLLRKDFIIDKIQIYETRVIGADAILLIVRALEKKLADFISFSKELGLSPLVEVHTREELDIALRAGAEIIGINNRNLDTFITNIETSRRLRALIPADKIVVAESGIKERRDIESLIQVGINAFLIGENLVTAPDIGKKLREFKGAL